MRVPASRRPARGRPRTLLLAVAAALVAALLAGCGGSPEGGTPRARATTGSPSPSPSPSATPSRTPTPSAGADPVPLRGPLLTADVLISGTSTLPRDLVRGVAAVKGVTG